MNFERASVGLNLRKIRPILANQELIRQLAAGLWWRVRCSLVLLPPKRPFVCSLASAHRSRLCAKSLGAARVASRRPTEHAPMVASANLEQACIAPPRSWRQMEATLATRKATRPRVDRACLHRFCASDMMAGQLQACGASFVSDSSASECCVVAAN